MASSRFVFPVPFGPGDHGQARIRHELRYGVAPKVLECQPRQLHGGGGGARRGAQGHRTAYEAVRTGMMT